MSQTKDTSIHKIDSLRTDGLRYPIKDRRGDWMSWKNNNPFDLKDSSFVKQKIEYDPLTNQFYLIEKIGNNYYRTPTSLTFQQYYQLQNAKSEEEYFKLRANALTALNKKEKTPKLTVYDKLFDRIFGVGEKGLKVDIRPQGSVTIAAGYQGQKTLNPTLPEAARKNGGFDFNMNTDMQVNANIGDKLRLPISYNTLANFDYLNQIKLDYRGKDDEIIKSIQAGNISWQSRGTLMPSAQNLFGLKTQLQFGKLFITAAIANQRSQRQTQSFKGGSATTAFQKKLSDYEENKHFLMAQYFRNNFKKAMSNLPIVNSQVQIQRIEVWVTNRTGTATNARTIVGLADLGESQPYNPNIQSLTSNQLPQNGANNLYATVTPNRDPATVTNVLQSHGLTAVNDYEKTFARKLDSTEYYFNPQIGFISLLRGSLQPDDVLAISYQYTYNGRVYQVGEFSQDVALDSTQGVQKVLFVKLLKATSARTTLPIWKLMMKNVYSLDMTNVLPDAFQLNILYNQPSGGLNIYMPEASTAVNGKSLLNILNLDRLNSHNDPQPDGRFDFLPGFTIMPVQGRIMFPELEPFGRDLDTLAYTGVPILTKQKYIFYQLYDSIKAIAQTYANFDRFMMQGQAKGSGYGGEMRLNAYNVPPGSVKVTAGGQQLIEGVDFAIDYNLGTVKILNQAIINSNIPVNVSYENNGTFGLQQRGFFALRADYIANKKLSIGASMVRLNERPFFTKMNYGEDPIRNTMYGVDISYKSELPGLTKLLNKLPFYSTKAPSSITAYGEGAYLKPGHPPQIGSGTSGLIYLDDFEGSTSSIDMRFPWVNWALASTPQGNPQFPEATLTDSIDYGMNRAKLAWYNIEPTLQDKNSINNPLRSNIKELSDPRVRLVYTNELFPQQTTTITNTQTVTFDLAFYPTDPGPYNYTSDPSRIDPNGKLRNPAGSWGGIMRSIDQTDFESNNIQYVEFWLQDPFINNRNSTGGMLNLNLGEVSEDILKDGQRFYENGLNTPTIPTAVDSTSSTWGKFPTNPIQVTNAFSNDPNDRPYQDVGFDGLDNDGERRKRADYLNKLAANFGINSTVYKRAYNDPSNDDYIWYRSDSLNALGAGILARYKNYNNPQGNSSIANSNSPFSPAATVYPDNEDLNHDNTLNETESYYDYQIKLRPNMAVGTDKYITDKRTLNVSYADGHTGQENWYLFRVPITDYAQKVGQIPDFKSIRFMRLYLSNFTDSVVLRFASLNLVRNQWRQFTFNLDTTGSYTPVNNSSTVFNTLAVNLEANSSRTPVNYVIPPGIQRVQSLSNNGVNILQNEQSLSLQVSNLAYKDSRAIFKTLPNYDLRQYGQLSMFAHAESVIGQTALNNGDVSLVVRIGQDYLNNYYEIKIPLIITPPGSYSASTASVVWPDSNNLDFQLQDLINLKLQRNNAGASLTQIYRQIIGNKTFSIMGNPNLGAVQGILVAVQNSRNGNTTPLSTEVWIDELRLSKINEHGAYAALGKVDVQLADLGKLSVSANTYSDGWGSIDSHIGDRALNSMFQFDAALSIEAGKLVPQKARLSIPVYASINKTIITPKYDPYNLDILFKDELSAAKTQHQRDSLRNAALDVTTIKTLNFTNVHVMPKGNIHFWSLSNFNFNYSYTVTTQTNPSILQNLVKRYRGGFGYMYAPSPKFKEPFKKWIKNQSPWLGLVRDFNFSLTPSLISVRTDINRQFGQYIPRIVNTPLTISKVQTVDTTYDKYFTFDKYYTLRWNLTRSINVDFSAISNARVDEPYGALNTKAKRDSVWRNFIKGGRTVAYQQTAAASYEFPLSKLPFTDWIRAHYSYGTSYNWITASLLAISLGNTIENSQTNTLGTEFDFTRLYNKNKWLRTVSNVQSSNNRPPVKNNNTNQLPNNNQPKKNALGITILSRDEVIRDSSGNYLRGKKKREALRKWRQQKRDLRIAERLQKANQPIEISGLERTLGGLVTMVKQVNINYTESYNSRVPGYMDSTQFMGQNWRTMQPGIDYVFGKQPDTAWLNRKAAQGVISRDSTFNYLFAQNFDQKLNITARVQPIRDFVIDINFDKSFSKNYTELFKDTTGLGVPQHLNPYAAGGFSVSFISFQTLFKKTDPNNVSKTFETFENNRLILSNRVANGNAYWVNAGKPTTADGYASGYGRYAQDVLVPAFIAAYTNKDPNSIPLIAKSQGNIRSNPFSGYLPKPNWRVSYTGLSKIPSLQNTFASIIITHAYSGTLSMNGFSSALNYADPFRYNAPGFIDTISGNYVPFFLVPNITMQEAFSPLLGIDVTTRDRLNIKVEYKKSRILSLSLIDYQMSETNSTEWTLGAGWHVKGLVLPFKVSETSGNKLDNDLGFRLDLSMRNDATNNSRLDQTTSYGTGGGKSVIIQPSIDYVLNKRINLKLYFYQRRYTPYISTSAPTVNTNAGLQVKIGLGP
jgi:cell surface protein SprA